MSQKELMKWKKIKNKYLKNWKNWLISFVLSLLILPFIFIFNALNKSWADGMSVGSIFYIGISLLSIIFKFANFQTWKKLKNLFVIKKENKEPFTKLEKTQMDVLNIKLNLNKKEFDPNNLLMISIVMLIYGFLLLTISLPFII